MVLPTFLYLWHVWLHLWIWRLPTAAACPITFPSLRNPINVEKLHGPVVMITAVSIAVSWFWFPRRRNGVDNHEALNPSQSRVLSNSKCWTSVFFLFSSASRPLKLKLCTLPPCTTDVIASSFSPRYIYDSYWKYHPLLRRPIWNMKNK